MVKSMGAYHGVVSTYFNAKLFGQQKIIASILLPFIISKTCLTPLMISYNDDEWTPKGLNIGHQKYHQKLENLSSFIGDRIFRKQIHPLLLFRNRKSWCSRGFNQAPKLFLKTTVSSI
jgi:hypothetical protein